MADNISSSADRPFHAIVSIRSFPFPRETVFAAFSDPGRLAQWWGPAGFTNTFHECDFRSGGRWRFTMRGPDGNAFEMDKRFEEVAPPGRIVLRHIQEGHDFSLIITFEATAGGTKVTWDMRFDDPAEAERLRGFLLPANEQNFDRLAAHLSGSAGSNR